MTLLIDKSQSNTRLILTGTEAYADFTGAVLSLKNEATNVSLELSLPSDSSPYPARYNQFILATTAFSGLSVGMYEFTITSSLHIQEQGQLKVLDAVLSEQQELDANYTYITPQLTDDDFIVYQP